ncbi:Isopentenyl-diphosphate delta-isomerase, FMN-dependent [hydrothermal vent metagenome]|uniref:Isopentenyl-diphosphate delta-isomerase, FMN-dependent n=1 Tax=hydrothermal vent metagenome TaxID=652676 RepID=A0A3B1C7W1_9ZZZZ
MSKTYNQISKRKAEHIDLCLNEDVVFNKSNGLEQFDFVHDALTEVLIDEINFETRFLGKIISYPFMISSMTGGTGKAKSLNENLAIAANEFNIPIGVGSQRPLLESLEQSDTFKIIREKAPNVPILSNIGAAQIVQLTDVKSLLKIIEAISADGLIIHLNPLQELLQREGEINFKGLLNKIKEVQKQLEIPLIIKEVGSGINQNTARKLLDIGVDVIDVAGSGGTSWAAVELLRNPKPENDYFSEWGLRTSFCVRGIAELKDEYDFTLISSGGIDDFVDAAKSLAIGADMFASARIILKTVEHSGVEGVIKLIEDWFNGIRKIMFLTGSKNILELQQNKIFRKKELF